MSDLSSFRVAIIGAGPAGLMATDVISAAGVRVTVFERMPSAGRKFLMAGRGGLNLTHGEELEAFLARYGTRAQQLRSAIEMFPPAAVRAWCEDLGQLTFVGTSGRVFPRAMKTSPLLRAWLRRLGERGVELRTGHRWNGWDETDRPTFETPAGPAAIAADATVLALGGASWPGLGSDGAWVDTLARVGANVAPLQPANCGFRVGWSQHFLARWEGEPLKRIAIRHGADTARGELVCTAIGLEGGAIYAVAGSLRETVVREGSAKIEIDLRPDIALGELSRTLETPRRKQSLSSFLRKTARLSPAAIGLLQEAAHLAARPLRALHPAELAALIKALPLELTGIAPIEKAISTAGGVAFDAVDHDFMLVRRPGVFVAGEMLDWEAPTGGYLLQACFSTGAAAGRGVLSWLVAQR